MRFGRQWPADGTTLSRTLSQTLSNSSFSTKFATKFITKSETEGPSYPFQPAALLIVLVLVVAIHPSSSGWITRTALRHRSYFLRGASKSFSRLFNGGRLVEDLFVEAWLVW